MFEKKPQQTNHQLPKQKPKQEPETKLIHFYVSFQGS